MTRGRILPGRTSGASPHLTAPGTVPRFVPAEDVAPHVRTAAWAIDRLLGLDGVTEPTAHAELVEPRLGGANGAVMLHIGASRWAVPHGVRIAAGAPGVMYVADGTALRVHVLVESGGRVRELLVNADLARRIRLEAFGR